MGAPASLRDDTPEDAPRCAACRFWKHKDGGDIVPTDATSTKAFLFLDPDDWIQVDVNGNPVGRWLDAPTCEGWWWFGEEVVEVYHDKRRNKLLVLYAGFDEQTEPKAGRWFGPLLPPSVVSGATSSGA